MPLLRPQSSEGKTSICLARNNSNNDNNNNNSMNMIMNNNDNNNNNNMCNDKCKYGNSEIEPVRRSLRKAEAAAEP